MASLNKNAYIVLYACCIPVKGAMRSLLVDTEREDFHFIPNDLYNIITKDFYKLTIGGIFLKYGKENKKQLQEYLEFLLANELAFITDEPKLFPKLSLNWESPRLINNAIIDISSNSKYDFSSVILQLDEIGTECIQVRFFQDTSSEYLSSLLSIIEDITKRVRSIEFLIKFNDKEDYSNLYSSNLLSSVIFYEAPEDKLTTHDEINIPIIYTTQEFSNCSSCGNINPMYFAPNISHITESIHFNNCLNKKISIDELGEIKNCPSFDQAFGNINNTLLKDVIGLTEFTSRWKINKQMITVCKDCEFRLICNDCRAYTVDDDIYSKPLKCKYDPYTCSWGS